MAVFFVSSFMVVIVIVGIEKNTASDRLTGSRCLYKGIKKGVKPSFINPYLLVKVTGNYLCSK